VRSGPLTEVKVSSVLSRVLGKLNPNVNLTPLFEFWTAFSFQQSTNLTI